MSELMQPINLYFHHLNIFRLYQLMPQLAKLGNKLPRNNLKMKETLSKTSFH